MERYDIVKDIGSGNFGVAKLVRDKFSKELFAVKVIERGQKSCKDHQGSSKPITGASGLSGVGGSGGSSGGATGSSMDLDDLDVYDDIDKGDFVL
ncbi:hypothetical protein Bca101_057365 [Brassica carinata]